MLTIQSLREEKDRILAALDKRHFDAREAIEQILDWDAERRKI
jgi:seryl-tRNA synthetase